MQAWAKRGIQTALVTGGLLMLGTGIASADEDVNPDKPASPLDTRTQFRFDAANNTVTTPIGKKALPDVKREFSGSPRDAVEDLAAAAKQKVPTALARVPAQPKDVPATLLEPTAARDELPEVPRLASADTADAALDEVQGESESTMTHGFLAPDPVDLDWTFPVPIGDHPIALASTYGAGDLVGGQFGESINGLNDGLEGGHPGQYETLTHLQTGGHPAQNVFNVVEPALGEPDHQCGERTECATESEADVSLEPFASGDHSPVTTPIAGAAWAAGRGVEAVASRATAGVRGSGITAGVNAPRDRAADLLSGGVPEVSSVGQQAQGVRSAVAKAKDDAVAAVPTRKVVMRVVRMAPANPRAVPAGLHGVPVDVLADSLTTSTHDNDLSVNDGSQQLSAPVVGDSLSPSKAPSLMPFGWQALLKEVSPVTPPDDFAGTFSGLLGRGAQAAGVPGHQVVQSVAHTALAESRTRPAPARERSNPFPRLTGDLFGTDVLTREQPPAARVVPGLGNLSGNGLLPLGNAGGLANAVRPLAAQVVATAAPLVQGVLPAATSGAGGLGGLGLPGGRTAAPRDARELPVVGELPINGLADSVVNQRAAERDLPAFDDVTADLPLADLIDQLAQGHRAARAVPAVDDTPVGGQLVDRLGVEDRLAKTRLPIAGRMPIDPGFDEQLGLGDRVAQTELPHVGKVPFEADQFAAVDRLADSRMPNLNGLSTDDTLPIAGDLTDVEQLLETVKGLQNGTSALPLPTALPTALPTGLPTALPTAVPTTVPALGTSGRDHLPPAASPVDVTQVIPTIPSFAEAPTVRVPRLEGVPAMANVPALDRGTLTDTRAALDHLFTNHPIG